MQNKNIEPIEAKSPAPVVHPSYDRFAKMLEEWVYPSRGNRPLSAQQADIFLQVLPEIRIVADMLDYEQELRFPAQLAETAERLAQVSSKVFTKVQADPEYRPTAQELQKIYRILCMLDLILGYKDVTGLGRLWINSATIDQIYRTKIKEPVTELSASDFDPRAMPPDRQRRFVRFIHVAAHAYLKYRGIEPLFVRRGAPGNVIRGILLEALLQAYEKATGRKARRNDKVLHDLIPCRLLELYEEINRSPVRFACSDHVDNKKARARASELLCSVRYLVKLERAAGCEISLNDRIFVLAMALKRLNRQHKIEREGRQLPKLFSPNEVEDCNWQAMHLSVKLQIGEAAGTKAN